MMGPKHFSKEGEQLGETCREGETCEMNKPLVLSTLKPVDRQVDRQTCRRAEVSDSNNSEGCVSDNSNLHNRNQCSQEEKCYPAKMFNTFLQDTKNMKRMIIECYFHTNSFSMFQPDIIKNKADTHLLDKEVFG